MDYRLYEAEARIKDIAAEYVRELKAMPLVRCDCCGKMFDHRIEGIIWGDGSCLCGVCD